MDFKAAEDHGLTQARSLILLLILSDMLKTLWLVILPASEMVQGTIASVSGLCQVSGFFLSVGIEACDLAVLLMAVHTGLYIFRGRTGLYPYRFSAYTVVAILSFMLASLAFINNPAFVNSGPYCYLPSHPEWTSRALSWIPRYVVVLTIMFTYTCVYTYVRCVMTKSGRPLLGRLLHADEPQLDHGHHGVQQQSLLPQTPPIAYHGLIPPTPPCEQKKSDRTLVLAARLNLPPPCHQKESTRMSSLVWQSNERTDMSLTSPHFPDSSPCAICNNDRPGETSDSYISPCHCDGRKRLVSTAPSRTVDVQPRFSQQANAPAHLRNPRLFIDGPRPETSDDESALPQLIFSPTTLHATGMPRVRDKIRRQLGQLFVYPLVYMTGWLIPFISHVVGDHTTGRPFWLVAASLISLCTQGLADSAVFLMMEKPWRYWSRDDVTAWCCFWWSKQSCMKGTGSKVGRTREEMLIDGSIARRRRELERVEGMLRFADRGPNSRDWWDHSLVEIDESTNEDAEAVIRSYDDWRG
ncbi:hypothetical protein E4U43_001146 [Claviceps pusilla]|uniref:Uncharacterized protein n=1 Tax=Claviceps pusilla TaxID=123648 RepID=A0A9P7NGK6_9HYPO|nr:hypothetical protein E4U43_001146 [Claviceps pusilla]